MVLFNKYFCWLQEVCGSNISVVCGGSREYIVHTSASFLPALLIFMKNHTNCLFKVLVDIVCIDRVFSGKRFQVRYLLLSIHYSCRVSVVVNISARDSLGSCTFLYSSSGWHEREVFDIFGVVFKNNHDLRRILTDYGFEGFPLRKDFPLSGYTEVRYDAYKNRVVCEPLELVQEFRKFKGVFPSRFKSASFVIGLIV